MAYERDRTSTTELVSSPTPSLPTTPAAAADNRFTTNPEEKFRVRLAAEGYDGNGAMKYQDYSTDDTDDDEGRVKGKNRRKSKYRCDQVASPILIILTVCLLVVVGFVLIAILLKIQLDKTSRQCQSPDCVTTSGVMLSKMDLTANPCTDFYQYACDAFTKDVMIPPDRVVWTTFNTMNQKSTAVLRQLLEDDGIEYRGKNSTAVQKAKQFYSACLNLTTSEIQGNTPLLRLIKSLGSWSFTTDSTSGNWSQSVWNFEQTISLVHSYGVAPFFVLDVGPDDKNSSVNIIQIDQAGLSFSDYESYIGNDSDLFHDAYVHFFTDVVRLLGGGMEPDQTSHLIEKVWQLEKALARAFLKPSERADAQAMYNIRTVSEVQQLFGSAFNFSEYLMLMFGTSIPSTEKLIVRVPEYFHRLGIILSRSSKETLADYIVWTMVQRMLAYMSTSYQLALLKLKSTVYKVNSVAPRWESCVARTGDAFGFATGALYIDTHFSQADKENVEDLYRTIVRTFRSRIPTTDWMDDETKVRAIEKVDGLVHKIGYPDFLLDTEKLDAYYAKVVVTDEAFQNALNAEVFTTNQIKERRGMIPDRTEWLMSPAEVNAYYDPSRNQIVLPAGILHEPFIKRSFPKSLSFGALGFIIGHEMTHGFDNSGRQFDKYGNMIDWWSNGSAQEFKERSQCLVDEYSNFLVYGKNIDGVSTLGENIADNGGIKISLEAYENWLKMHGGEDELLTGLNMTSVQQFFLSYAQVWCTFYTRQYAIQSIVTDSHSNARYRVNGVLQNVPKFSQAFSCPLGSPMNPAKKCSLW